LNVHHNHEDRENANGKQKEEPNQFPEFSHFVVEIWPSVQARFVAKFDKPLNLFILYRKRFNFSTCHFITVNFISYKIKTLQNGFVHNFIRTF